MRRRGALLDGTPVLFLRLLGAPGLADVYPTGRRWMAMAELPVLWGRDFTTKREAMRWVERRVTS